MAKIVIAGGGTGGHVYPGVAVAEELRRRHPDWDISFIGTLKGLESRILPETGFHLHLISVRGLPRRPGPGQVVALFSFVKGVFQAWGLLKREQPQAVLATGGFVSAPVIVAARLMGIPVVLQEQNSVPGLTNRWLSRFAREVHINFSESRQYFRRKNHLKLTGNPVRKEVLAGNRRESLEKYGLDSSLFTVFVFGGSRGARSINQAIVDAWPILSKEPGLQLIVQTGTEDFEWVGQKITGPKAVVREYLAHINEAYSIADLVVARAGAMTISEIAACGLASILVPYPHAAMNHQLINAQNLVERGAASMLRDEDLSGERLAKEIMALVHEPQRLKTMGRNARSFGRVDAAERIARSLERIAEPESAATQAEAVYKKSKKIHLVGIGGTGMCGIAEVLLTLGYNVSGSDQKPSETTERLARLGGRIFDGHQPGHVEGADLVVISSAIRPDNPEYHRARVLGIPVIRRAEMLAELMRMKYGVAVAGAHGKTTTTSLVAMVLAQGGLDPTVVVGGRLKALGSNARLGEGKFLVAEADESDGSFLLLSPAIAVVTNLDAEHLDFYDGMVEIRTAFVEFVNKVPFYGLSVLCAEDPGVWDILPFVKKRHVTYAINREADWRATAILRDRDATRFTAEFQGVPWGEFRVRLYGRHNVLNALAAVAVGRELELTAEQVREGLAAFTGVGRRFERKGEAGGVTVVDDYGHHPTELAAVLDTAAALKFRRVVAVFQPHRYSRTADHWEAFGKVLTRADAAFVLPIYAAGEDALPGVSSQKIVDAAREAGARDVRTPAGLEEAAAELESWVRPGDLVLHLGAGDVWKVGERLLQRLEPARGEIS